MQNEKVQTKQGRNEVERGSRAYAVLPFSLFVLTFSFLTGCQQKMADQPAHRPYEESTMFEYNQSARPLENGVVHRNQPLPDDALINWLTPQGKVVKADPEWQKLVDPVGKTIPPPGSPTDVANFVNEFPFELKEADFKRGQMLYNSVCAECHGAVGNANGKIPERGFLRPPSYHRDPDDKLFDYSRLVVNATTGKADPSYLGNKQGTSRGFYRYGKVVPLDQVPVGYIFQVITWGYGGMASHDTQLPNPADRWRVAGYIRALQLSQSAKAADLTPEQKKALDTPGQNKAGGIKHHD